MGFDMTRRGLHSCRNVESKINIVLQPTGHDLMSMFNV